MRSLVDDRDRRRSRVDRPSGKDVWWVRVQIAQPDGTGRVSVTNLQEGPENQPVPGPTQVPTTFC
ncbi:hypothetical protein [Pseudonocardia pini]|uniref:hypothetical protein n=1 Tax=Pseudonocardia pini TaxID=2758030 RepID=UPI0015F047D5|nr:hypothetical protein [Pseudonocardia pini]